MPARLQVFGSDAGVLGDARKHSRADFFGVVKREDYVGPALAGQSAVRTRLSLEFPLTPNSAASNRLALMDGH